MNEVTYFEMLETQQSDEYVPQNLSEMTDEEIAEYEEYCKILEEPYSDDELCKMQKELDL